ncbi:MAG: aminotransferase class V-fold PLP-dependent enzyme [Oligoflexia bacterium]|nr:aminotransferase class V-fold PLP-dependent enzyme [Oligoflexia bacterium]
MTPIYLTPGPTALHPKIEQLASEALRTGICSISHRSKDFEAIYRTTATALRDLMNVPDSHNIFFLGSAHEAMERLIQGCVKESSFHFVNGAFSKRFFDIATECGKSALKAELPLGEGFNLDIYEIPQAAEMICLTHNETSTGVWLKEEQINNLKRRYPDRLIAVDIVSSAPYARINYQYVDAAFFSVQKLFGLPAGLGVLIANARCIDRAALIEASGLEIGSYHNLLHLKNFADTFQTPATPNVLGIYLLGGVSRELVAAGGADALRAGIDQRSRMLVDFLERSEHYAPAVSDPEFRSRTVITIKVNGEVDRCRRVIQDHGLHVGSGYGELRKSQIRIANFSMHTDRDYERLLEALSAASR